MKLKIIFLFILSILTIKVYASQNSTRSAPPPQNSNTVNVNGPDYICKDYLTRAESMAGDPNSTNSHLADQIAKQCVVLASSGLITADTARTCYWSTSKDQLFLIETNCLMHNPSIELAERCKNKTETVNGEIFCTQKNLSDNDLDYCKKVQQQVSRGIEVDGNKDYDELSCLKSRAESESNRRDGCAAPTTRPREISTR